ncbi:MAG: SpoIIE family protein phosphatase [Oscillochloridaceae bacterium]|nr:SpoIIE family protein phosphatase [Chloroflexaceae bacterium]MDW8391214.1 SpoIIE family protein phosphatase [Oscillochloridaceae bacterium]
MLVTLLSSQYARFAALAESWLLLGATAFGIYQDGRPLVYWPASHRLMRPSLTAPILSGDEELGEIRVTGVQGEAFQQRLRADAALIAYVLQLEEELQLMTADLVISQDQQLALYRLTQRMRDLVTVEEILRVALAEAIHVLKAQGGFAAFESLAPEPPLLIQLPDVVMPEALAWDLYRQCCTGERPIIRGETDLDTALPGLHSLLHVPIRIRGHVIAALAVVNRSGGFAAPDIKLAGALAEQAGVQIERTLLYQEMFQQTRLRTEMELARRVQVDLLPRTLPRIDGLEIYAESRPARQVGGDFYDFIVEPGRPFIFVVGDVTGKGISAALLMTMTRTAIHSKSQFMPFPTPESVMRQSNEDLYDDFTRVGVFATAFVGQYEVGRQQIIYANAGHAPVIYRPLDGEAVLLRAESTALGILPEAHCRNQSLRLVPGDLLVVATDGFSDMRDANEATFGIQRLLELVDRLHHLAPRELALALFEEVERFGQGREQDDDQTIVVIKGAAM